MQEYLNTARALLREMQVPGNEPEEHRQVTKVMAGLSREYRSLVSSFNAVASAEKLTWEIVEPMLMPLH